MNTTDSDREPPYEITILAVFIAVCVGTLMVILATGHEPDAEAQAGSTAFKPEDFGDIDWNEPLLAGVANGVAPDAAGFAVPRPPFKDDEIFPCSECHEDLDSNATPRKLEMAHKEIVLGHGPGDRWCFDCHNPDDRDKLRLANGSLIEFAESYRLCGQCHGTIYRDWRAGIHGRRRGYWDGAKSYLLCVHCHDPHTPKFRKMKPLPPPMRPEFFNQGNRPNDEAQKTERR